MGPILCLLKPSHLIFNWLCCRSISKTWSQVDGFFLIRRPFTPLSCTLFLYFSTCSFHPWSNIVILLLLLGIQYLPLLFIILCLFWKISHPSLVLIKELSVSNKNGKPKKMRKAKTPVSSKHQMLRLYKLILLNIRLKKMIQKWRLLKSVY